MKRTLNTVLDEAAELPMKLSVVLLHPRHKSQRPFAMIEGDKASLELLAKVIHAAANRDDCGFHIGPGNLYFTECSELGLFLHRVPCEDSEPDGRC